MKKWLAAITLMLILGLVFGSAQVYASSGSASGNDQLVELKKTKQPGPPEQAGVNQGVDKKATQQSEKDLREAEREQLKAEKAKGKKVHFRGVVSAVGATDFTLDVGGSPITFAVDENTQIKIPTLGKNAHLTMLNVGVKASVQAMEIVESEASEEAPVETAAVEPAAATYLALKVQVIPGKPVRIHRVGIVTNYQKGVSITILAKGESFTFIIAPGAKILPAERADELAVGRRVTVISRRDPTGGPLTAQGIVVHPESQADEDVTEPTDITLSANTVAENAPLGTVVGTFTATDPTPGDTFTFTLVTGTGDTDNALFTITGNQLIAKGPFNFETKPTLSIRVRVTDQNGSFFEKVFTITVTNVVETAPTDITLTPAAVAENAVVGTIVGALTATDADLGETFTFTLVAGTGDTDNLSFTISGANLLTAAVFDFETKSSYSIRVKVTDADGLFFEKAFTITVTDVVEP